MRKTILISVFALLLLSGAVAAKTYSVSVSQPVSTSSGIVLRGPIVTASVPIAPIYCNGTMCSNSKATAPTNDPRFIMDTNNSQAKQDAVSKGCKIVYELDEQTVVDCPDAIGKALPNSIPDQKYQLADLTTSIPIPNSISPQDLMDNTYMQAPRLWDKNITGRGTVVAVMDTGIDYTHPSLSNHILANKSFVSYTNDPMDDIGHGTHVAGIITSDGNPEITECWNATDDSYIIIDCSKPHQYENLLVSKDLSKGIAPDAKIMMAKVCGFDGCWLSDIIAGLDWAVKGTNVSSSASCYTKCGSSSLCCKAATECTYNTTAHKCTGNYTKTEIIKPDVISISLGSSRTWLFGNCDKDPFAKKINDIVSKYRIPVVVAAGNSGWGVSSPGCARNAIVAGASGSYPWPWCPESSLDCWYKNIVSFSGRGYAMKDHGVIAPGVYVFSTVPNGTCDLCSLTGFNYLSGTSMATPDVAGMVALMKQQHPSWSVSQIKYKLFNTATPMKYGFYFEEGYEDYEQGHGLMNATAVSS